MKVWTCLEFRFHVNFQGCMFQKCLKNWFKSLYFWVWNQGFTNLISYIIVCIFHILGEKNMTCPNKMCCGFSLDLEQNVVELEVNNAITSDPWHRDMVRNCPENRFLLLEDLPILACRLVSLRNTCWRNSRTWNSSAAQSRHVTPKYQCYRSWMRTDDKCSVQSLLLLCAKMLCLWDCSCSYLPSLSDMHDPPRNMNFTSLPSVWMALKHPKNQQTNKSCKKANWFVVLSGGYKESVECVQTYFRPGWSGSFHQCRRDFFWSFPTDTATCTTCKASFLMSKRWIRKKTIFQWCIFLTKDAPKCGRRFLSHSFKRKKERHRTTTSWDFSGDMKCHPFSGKSHWCGW